MPSRAVVDQLTGCRVLVIGDVMLDEYLRGDVSRISPEAPVPVLEFKSYDYRLGGAANAAANIQALGGVTTLVGVVGLDAGADTLKAQLASHHIDGALVTDPARPTSKKTRLVAQGQQMVRVDHERRDAVAGGVADAVRAAIDGAIRTAQAMVLSDYAKGMITPEVAHYAIRAARAAGVPIVVDPKQRSFVSYAGATVITPNLHELEAAAPAASHAAFEVERAANALLPSIDGAALLVTRSADGMTLFRAGQPSFHVPAMAQEVFDVTGAGDTVVATLALALAARVPIEDAIRLASFAAAIAVSKRGTSTVSPSELAAAIGK
jgi:D-beta-D-heptose 7-phosphate kinase/D-beta-D-heptose 1-phosphate adenosyltransferase